MKKMITSYTRQLSALLLALAAVTLASSVPASAGTSAPAKETVETGLDGAKLWGQNCTRCHNARPPGTYSDSQWDVIVHHMRIRAYLTVRESQAIATFLKDGN